MFFNVTFIIAVLIVLLFIFLGAKRGFIMTIYHLLAFVIVIVATLILSPYVTDFAIKNEKIYGMIYRSVDKTIDIDLFSEEKLEEYVKNMNLPSVVEEGVINKGDNIKSSVNTLKEVICRKISNMIVSIACMIITFIVITIIVAIIFKLLDLVARIPVLNTANRFGGAAVGIVEAVSLIWFICGLVPVFSTTEIGMRILSDINNNKILLYMYEHNLISEIVSGNLLSGISSILIS